MCALHGACLLWIWREALVPRSTSLPRLRHSFSVLLRRPSRLRRPARGRAVEANCPAERPRRRSVSRQDVRRRPCPHQPLHLIPPESPPQKVHMYCFCFFFSSLPSFSRDGDVHARLERGAVHMHVLTAAARAFLRAADQVVCPPCALPGRARRHGRRCLGIGQPHPRCVPSQKRARMRCPVHALTRPHSQGRGQVSGAQSCD